MLAKAAPPNAARQRDKGKQAEMCSQRLSASLGLLGLGLPLSLVLI